jgi:hypothetical protein
LTIGVFPTMTTGVLPTFTVPSTVTMPVPGPGTGFTPCPAELAAHAIIATLSIAATAVPLMNADRCM